MTHSVFSPADGVSIAYHRTDGDGHKPSVMFCHGLKSDMSGNKALYLEEHCKRLGRGFIRFDCQGHGLSSGDFTAGSVDVWAQDALAVLDHLTSGPVVLAGSSMGGWISMLLALKRPARIHGFLGIAAAPDFTEDIYHREFSDADRAELADRGIVYRKSAYGDPYPLSQRLFDGGRHCLILGAPVAIRCPVRLVQGKADAAVRWTKAETILQRVESTDKKVTWIDDGDHRLSRPQDLRVIAACLDDLL